METAKRIGTENEQTRPPRQKKLIFLGILVLILILVMVSLAIIEFNKRDVKKLVFIHPTEKTFIKTKTVSARVVQSDTETIYVNASKGSIKEIFVKEGERVAKGQQLFSYEGSALKAELGQAEVNKQLAETSAQQLKEQIASLETDILEAESTTIPVTSDPTNLTDVGDSGSIADQSILSLNAELNTVKADAHAAELKVEKYTLEAEKLKAELDSLIVSSNTAGVIVNLNKNVGQGFQAKDNQQLAIMKIASNAPVKIEGKLTEAEKAKITQGQPITVTSNVVANKKWSGKITEVSDYPTYKGPVKKEKDLQNEPVPSYSFEASLDSQKGLYPGYSTSLDVVVQSKPFLAVPETSIIGIGKSTYVMVQKKGILQKQKVETGQKRGQWVAILKGLKGEDKVGVNPSWIVHLGTLIHLN
ncbi:efflux RND transporter periplasmic adaptor subunit [Neobacillus drentensis]|uniref:efflux RND transporter periplasmic adaptor subunit n=1 Tax=Neobacillus drentensis TaxID=220684 RepID=UPI001F24786F|nr:efflux RND transporter periplasmic adaptor subunit [Neobacillus drentensis]ULT59569.1 efflux RND transporter periplasmic adaptor subunit [Neobacillus drentensis]